MTRLPRLGWLQPLKPYALVQPPGGPTKKGAENLGALSRGLECPLGLFAAANLQAEFVGEFVRFVERPFAAVFDEK